MSAQASEKKLNEKLLGVLIGPHITEKTSLAMRSEERRVGKECCR